MDGPCQGLKGEMHAYMPGNGMYASRCRTGELNLCNINRFAQTNLALLSFFLLQNCTLSLRPKKEILKQSLDKQQVQLITYQPLYYSSRFYLSNQAKNRKCLNIRQHQNIKATTAKPSCMDLAISTIQHRERRKNEMSWLHEASVSQWNNRSS